MTDLNQRGLYTPQLESDACGIGLIAHLEKSYSHQLVSDALLMLENMEHRGACGCDPESGDGAGILIHIPHRLYASETLGFELPRLGEYGVGCFFFPKGQDRTAITNIIRDTASEFDLEMIGSREVPVDSSIPVSYTHLTLPTIYSV